MIRVVGIGASGHAKVVIDILRLRGFEVAGLLDTDASLWGTEVAGVRVLGGDELMAGLHAQGVRHAFIGVGAVKDTGPRRRAYEAARAAGFEVVDAVHPSAVVASSATMGHGVTVMAAAVVNAEARLGDNVIVNTGAVVEHDCVVGDHAHIATGAHLAGGVTVGVGAHVGLGASVRQGAVIGAAAVVAAGAAVVKDVLPNATVAGVPARPLEKAEVLTRGQATHER